MKIMYFTQRIRRRNGGEDGEQGIKHEIGHI
jgi:hypothetical protein